MDVFGLPCAVAPAVDLLDLNQQFQSAPAIAIKDDEAIKLTKEYFPTNVDGGTQE